MANKEIRVPDIGDFKGVEIIEVHIAAGDEVAEEDPLITLESDKASMDVPAPETGTVAEVKVQVGDKVSEGDLILMLAAAGAEAEAPAAEGPAAETPAPPAESSTPAAGGGVAEVTVPDIGDFSDVDIIEVHVAPGDTVAEEDSLITLESDKASMDVPSPVAGTVKEVKVQVGGKVSEGDLILLMEAAGGAPAPAAASAPAPAPAAAAPAPEAPAAPREPPPTPAAPSGPVDEAAFAKVHASPSVRRFARELGVDLGKVSGSGRKGRITKQDVQGFVKQVMAGTAAPAAAGAPVEGSGIPPIPAVDFAKFGEIETKPLSKIKKLTGLNLSRSWLNLPHVTYSDEVDITDTEAFRKSLADEAKKREIRVTMLSFLLKAAAAALREFPTFNSSLDPGGENLILKKYVHIGVAVDTPDGLVVPVIRDVDKKNIFELSADLGDFSAKARAKKLMPGDMQGGCFTISSLGGIGGTGFTPIVNAPEVSILGVTRAKMAPVWNGSEFVPRLMQPLSLSYDHRVIDGAEGARFLKYLGSLVSDVRRLLL